MEKRGCCSGGRCCGLPTVKTCFVLAIINAIIASIGVLLTLSALGYIISLWVTPDQDPKASPIDPELLPLVTGMVAVSFVGGLVGFVFAVFLCLGIRKRKSKLVMAFLVYGIIAEVLAVAGAVAFIFISWESLAYIAAALGICALYSFFLLLVQRTHIALTELPSRDQTKLVEYDYDG